MIGRAWWLAVAVLAACGAPPAPRPAPPPAASQAPVATDKASAPAASFAPAPTAPRPLLPDAPYRLAWLRPVGRWNQAVAVAPWGDVLVADRHRLRLLARHDGSVLEEVAIGGVGRGLGFVDRRTALAVTDDGKLWEVRFPGAKANTVHRLAGGLSSAAHIGAGAVAVSRDERVTVLARGSWQALLDVGAAGRVDSLALSADGALLAVATDRGLTVYSVTSGEIVWTVPDKLEEPTFSPDGAMLLVHGSGWKAKLLDARSGRPLREYRADGWHVASRFVTAELAVASGPSEIELFPVAASRQILGTGKVSHGAWEGLGAAADASLLCAGDRSGNVACFATAHPTPTGYPALSTRLELDARAHEAAICKRSIACVELGTCSFDRARGCVAASDAECAASQGCKRAGQCRADGGHCVATEPSCRASEPCRKAYVCQLYEGACVIGDDGCRRRDGCRVDGRCTSVEGACQVGSSNDCWQSEGCAEHGLCSQQGQACVALADADCRQATACTDPDGNGSCTAKAGKCVLASDYGCKRSRGCHEHGECTYTKDSACEVQSDADCAASKACRDGGACRFIDGRCRVGSDADCKKSSRCVQDGLCSMVEVDKLLGNAKKKKTKYPRCIAFGAADCATSEACTKHGRCLAAADCVKTCADSSVCKWLGWCVNQGGRCVASFASCRRSVICRLGKACRAVGGRCVR